MAPRKDAVLAAIGIPVNIHQFKVSSTLNVLTAYLPYIFAQFSCVFTIYPHFKPILTSYSQVVMTLSSPWDAAPNPTAWSFVPRPHRGSGFPPAQGTNLSG